MIERLARAIYDAEDPLSGDTIATVIHMSEHLFWDGSPGSTDIEKQLEAVRVICRVAVRAALEALREPSDAMVEAGLESGPMYDDSIAYALPGIWQAMIDAALS